MEPGFELVLLQKDMVKPFETSQTPNYKKSGFISVCHLTSTIFHPPNISVTHA